MFLFRFIQKSWSFVVTCVLYFCPTLDPLWKLWFKFLWPSLFNGSVFNDPPFWRAEKIRPSPFLHHPPPLVISDKSLKRGSNQRRSLGGGRAGAGGPAPPGKILGPPEISEAWPHLQSGAKILSRHPIRHPSPPPPKDNVVTMIPNYSVGWNHSPNIVNGGRGEIVRKDRIIW
jgi:hypothetical protein